MRPGPRRSILAEHQVGGIHHDRKKESSKERLARERASEPDGDDAEDGHCFLLQSEGREDEFDVTGSEHRITEQRKNHQVFHLFGVVILELAVRPR